MAPMSAHLPEWLFQGIQARLNQVPLRRLQHAYSALGRSYGATPTFEPGGDAEARSQAYVAARMPATYAAVERALQQVPLAALAEAQSVLDLGAGPGTATWALRERVPGLREATLVETDAPTRAQGAALAALRPAPKELNLRWVEQPALDAAISAEPHDLVLMTYALEEAGGQQGAALVAAAWAKAKSGLLIVEPGTPAGFARILAAREQLLKAGGLLVAPCPQSGLCPQAGKIESAWCHFSVRLERRGLHRLVKGGDLGYEDEKFAFLFVSKTFSEKPAPYRLLSFPRRSNRHIELDVCSFDKKRKKLFLNRRETPANVRSAARKLNWGDAWDPEKVPLADEDPGYIGEDD